jgi:hypothetical protein
MASTADIEQSRNEDSAKLISASAYELNEGWGKPAAQSAHCSSVNLVPTAAQADSVD